MSSLSPKQYSAIILMQYLILLFDICVNSFVSFSRENPSDLLILYVTQNLCLIVALTTLLVRFFSTYIFQVGLIQLLYTRFRITLVLCILYIILSISLHIWQIKIHWSSPLKHYWSKAFHVLYSVHRGVAVLYYYFYKRASLRIADPRFYENSTWIQKQMCLP